MRVNIKVVFTLFILTASLVIKIPIILKKIHNINLFLRQAITTVFFQMYSLDYLIINPKLKNPVTCTTLLDIIFFYISIVFYFYIGKLQSNGSISKF